MGEAAAVEVRRRGWWRWRGKAVARGCGEGGGWRGGGECCTRLDLVPARVRGREAHVVPVSVDVVELRRVRVRIRVRGRVRVRVRGGVRARARARVTVPVDVVELRRVRRVC